MMGIGNNTDNVNYKNALIGTGTQYVDTGIPVTDSTVIKASVYIESFNRDYMNVFGTYLNECGCIRQSNASMLGFPYRGNSEVVNYMEITIPGQFDILYDLPNKTFGINGTHRAFNGANTQKLSNQTMWIFAKKQYGNNPNRIGSFKLYSFSMEELGKKIIYLLPALDSSGIACLYDKVSGRYFYNIGTGQFEYE